MANSKGVVVKILGKDYQVACSEEQTHELVEAALLLDSIMRHIRASGRIIGLERIAIMAALNLASDLQTCRNELKQLRLDTERRLAQMHDKIAEVLE